MRVVGSLAALRSDRGSGSGSIVVVVVIAGQPVSVLPEVESAGLTCVSSPVCALRVCAVAEAAVDAEAETVVGWSRS